MSLVSISAIVCVCFFDFFSPQTLSLDSTADDGRLCRHARHITLTQRLTISRWIFLIKQHTHTRAETAHNTQTHTIYCSFWISNIIYWFLHSTRLLAWVWRRVCLCVRGTVSQWTHTPSRLSWQYTIECIASSDAPSDVLHVGKGFMMAAHATQTPSNARFFNYDKNMYIQFFFIIKTKTRYF